MVRGVMAAVDQFRDMLMAKAVEEIRVASFEAPKALSFTEWRGRIERILTAFIEDYR
jgi:hypothetical protein